MDGACINLQAFYCQCCSLTGYATPVDKIMSEYNNIYLDQPRQQQGLFELQNY